ncbi:ATP-binding cassette domain-containing protein [Parabacteroides pacaensis]|uniref:ATP-binding cassette domain-containing protein n=1 Tax=Parabacteroides pacaensis TaxID=2086575 RepID=UPI000D0FD04F|nr:ATP-binding cassette domain-containing protein [Parabacteroides pacaensis]
MKKIIIPCLSFGLLLLVWQLGATGINKPELIPDLPRLLTALGGLFISESFYRSVITTLLRGVAGILLSFILAGGTALLFARIEWIYELFRPVIVLMRSVPVISFILLALIFLQPEGIPLIIAFLTMFPLLNENLTKGFKNLQPGWSGMARTFRIRKINYYTQILYPQIKPFLFSGLASAIGFGWRAIIMGEVLAQCTFGIGSEMKKAQTFIDVPSLLGWTLIAVVISFIFDKGVDKLSRIYFPIHYKPERKLSFPPAPIFSSQDKTIRLDNISKDYKGVAVLQNLSLIFEGSKIYGISAPSGTGKSTLLNLINGWALPSSGSIRINRQAGIACVFQEPELIPTLTVIENILLPLASLYEKEEANNRAYRFLRLVEMEDFVSRYPTELSYGQQQRVSLARALAYPSPILLLDEPFKGLDNELVKRIILRIHKLHADSKQTIIFVTHKPEELALLAETTIKLY